MSGYGSQQGRGSFGPPDGPVYQIEVVTSVGHSWSGRVERDLEDYFDRYGRPRVSVRRSSRELALPPTRAPER